MIGRAAALLEALSSAGDPEAVEAIAAARASGVTTDRLADAIEDVYQSVRPRRAILGTPAWILALSALIAASAGGYALHALAALLYVEGAWWALPLLPAPLLVWALMDAARRDDGGMTLDRATSADAAATMHARGIPVDAARAIVSFLGGGPSGVARSARARWRPLVLAGASSAVVILFWSTLWWLITHPFVGHGVLP